MAAVSCSPSNIAPTQNYTMSTNTGPTPLSEYIEEFLVNLLQLKKCFQYRTKSHVMITIWQHVPSALKSQKATMKDFFLLITGEIMKRIYLRCVCFGSGSGFSWVSLTRSGFSIRLWTRKAKMTHKKERKYGIP